MTWKSRLNLLLLSIVGVVVLASPSHHVLQALSLAPEGSLVYRSECVQAQRRLSEVRFRYENALRELAHRRQMDLERAMRITNLEERRKEIQRIEEEYRRRVSEEQKRFDRDNADIQAQCNVQEYYNPSQPDYFHPTSSAAFHPNQSLDPGSNEAFDERAEAAINQNFRQCMRDAADRFEQERLRLYEQYHRGYEEALRLHHERIMQAWNILDERQREEAMRAADREFDELTRESERARNEAINLLQRDYDTARRVCEDRRRDEERQFREEQEERERLFREEQRRREEEFRLEQKRLEEEARRQEEERRRQEEEDRRRQEQRDVGIGQRCRSDSNCGGNAYCSVRDGDCFSPCAPGVVCIQVCEGICKAEPRVSTPIPSSLPNGCYCVGGAVNRDCPVDFFRNPCGPLPG